MTSPEPDDGEPDGGGDGTSPASLSSMTKAQLLDYAEEHGVQGLTNKSTKADIIAAIER